MQCKYDGLGATKSLKFSQLFIFYFHRIGRVLFYLLKLRF